MSREAIEAMLQEDENTWMELTDVLDANPDVNLHAPGSKPWNNRDAYAHLARWLEYNTARIQAVLAGNPAPPPGENVEEVNARWQAEDASMSLEEARQWAEVSYQMRKRTLDSVPPSRWNTEIEKVAGIEGASHFREHLSYITLTDMHTLPGTGEEITGQPKRGGGMYEIIVEKHFEAAHYLRGYQGKCESMHGHRYRVIVRIKVSQLNDIGLAYDFGDVKTHLNLILDRYDHTCLNDISPFNTINPSAENIASTIYHELHEKLAAEPVSLSAVEAWETPYQGVVYTPDQQ